MAIDTTVQPFIQRMLMPPDPRAGAEALTGAVNNFMGAYLARQDVERDEAEKMANDPNYVPQGGFRKFARGFLGAPGMVEEGKQPFAVQRRASAERETTLNRQIDSLLRDPKALADEIGNLSPDQIPDWIQKNAGLAANPIGRSMLDAAGRAYSQTKEAQIQAGRARHLGNLAERYPNVDLTTPEGLAQAQKNESVRELYNRAFREGRTLNTLPDDWFNPDGTINEQKAVPGMGALPESFRFDANRFAPSETMKNLQALSEAEAAGDQNAISALRQKLNLGGLSQTDIIKFRSELRELESNILLPDDEKAKRREEIYRKYSAPTPATPSERRIKVTRPDGTTGTVPESRVKDLPPDWKTELDKG